MTFAKDTIKLGAARKIFAGATIDEIRIGDRVVGYKATIDGQTIENAGLTSICSMLWEMQREKVKTVTLHQQL